MSCQVLVSRKKVGAIRATKRDCSHTMGYIRKFIADNKKLRGDNVPLILVRCAGRQEEKLLMSWARRTCQSWFRSMNFNLTWLCVVSCYFWM